ncbi:MAG: FeoC-like transcriptional regulator [Methylococcaceae bacterium]
MILSELKQFLSQQKRASLLDLTQHFNVEADALRGMLEKWIQKGKVRKTALESGCGTGCCKCDPALTEIYEWLERP